MSLSVASACGKIILLGEHAVVYGQPAIAVPIQTQRVYVTLHPHPVFQLIAEDLGHRNIALDADEPIAHLCRLTLATLACAAPAVALHIRSHLPIASGLGSGAAISTAVARAICLACAADLSLEQLNSIVYEIEKHYHGTPSGVDNTVIVYEKPIWFIRGQTIEPITEFAPLQLVVANTGVAAPTYESVADVRRFVDAEPLRAQPILKAIGDITFAARSALQGGDLPQLGALMSQNHRLLQTLTVSSAILDQLVQVAEATGALGAKLSGGGRGGNMIALVRPDSAEAIRQALLDHGAISAFITEVKP